MHVSETREAYLKRLKRDALDHNESRCLVDIKRRDGKSMLQRR